MSIYEKNRVALELFGIPMGSFNKTTEHSIEVLTAKNGSKTCTYNGKFVHSRHNPEREAERMIQTAMTGKEDIVIFGGFGLGVHIGEFLKKYPRKPFLVFEPDEGAFFIICENHDLTHIFQNESGVYSIGSDTGPVINFLEQINAENIAFIPLRTIRDMYHKEFEALEKALVIHAERKEINRNTLEKFGFRWIRNLSKNIPLLSKASGMDALLKAFNNYPALVIAAGPGLDDIAHLLPDLKKRFVLIAVDTAAGICLRNCVDPDIIVVVDPQYWNLRHLDKTRTSRAIIVSESSTYPQVFRQLKGPVFFMKSIFPLGQYIEHEVKLGRLGAGGSVATTAWDLARVCGCSPIITAGLDLSYPQNKTHVKGNTFEERAHVISNRLYPAESEFHRLLTNAGKLTAESNNGSMVRTDKRLLSYRDWFSQQCLLHPEINTATVSKNGLRIEGMDYIDQETLLTYKPVRRSIDDIITRVTAGSKPIMSREQIRDRIGLLCGDLHSLIGECRRALELLQNHSGAAGELSTAALNDELEKIDKRITESTSREITSFLLQPVINEINSIQNTGGSAAAIITRSIKLYHQITESAKFHVKLLGRTLSFP